MQHGKAIREVEIEEGGARTVRGIWGYKITVKFNGTVVAEFHRDTLEEAQADFCQAGYKYVREKTTSLK